ncbi:unnamed protein product [Cylindrotheca closterium]|uniref:Uncharacterized protein n=1 Tax=Cylindrotheca closterium TaxID=2856 RepID=A0AAD2FHL6_9STRA|nr:unnamed protein product [Cylindrotheca closterium]
MRKLGKISECQSSSLSTNPVHQFLPPGTTWPTYTKYWALPRDEDNDSQNEALQDSTSIENTKLQKNTKIDEQTQNMLVSLLRNTDLLEVRLDATLCAIFGMARFLLYDLTLPRKKIPGMEIVDVVAVLNTFSSAAVLAILWSIAGVAIGLFDTRTNSKDDPTLLIQLIGTTAFSVPLWVFVEKVCHWPISAGLESASLVYAMLLSSLGVLGTMLIARTLSRFLP